MLGTRTRPHDMNTHIDPTSSSIDQRTSSHGRPLRASSVAIRASLMRFSPACVEAHTAPQHRRAGRHRPDIVLMDLQIPNMNGTDAIRTIRAERELEVLAHVAAGQANKTIAAHLAITEETVKGHVKSVLSKLGGNDRTHAVTIALKRGIIGL